MMHWRMGKMLCCSHSIVAVWSFALHVIFSAKFKYMQYLQVCLCVIHNNFSTVDVNFPCALLQTQLSGGPLGSFLLQNRNKPLQILGMLAGVIILMVLVTVIISTATFMRNKKSNRILPNRRVRRRPRSQHTWMFKNPFKKPDASAERFKVEEEEREPEVIVENVNYNNNVSNVVRHWPPPPPCAPTLPPPAPPYIPGERQWVVPTVSASVAPKLKKKPGMTRQDTMNKALVSELKMRLEQKRLLKHY